MSGLRRWSTERREDVVAFRVVDGDHELASYPETPPGPPTRLRPGPTAPRRVTRPGSQLPDSTEPGTNHSPDTPGRFNQRPAPRPFGPRPGRLATRLPLAIKSDGAAHYGKLQEPSITYEALSGLDRRLQSVLGDRTHGIDARDLLDLEPGPIEQIDHRSAREEP